MLFDVVCSSVVIQYGVNHLIFSDFAMNFFNDISVSRFQEGLVNNPFPLRCPHHFLETPWQFYFTNFNTGIVKHPRSIAHSTWGDVLRYVVYHDHFPPTINQD